MARWREGIVSFSSCSTSQPRKREELMTESKPFCISKWAVLSAWARVRDNKGAAGVDEVSIEAFDLPPKGASADQPIDHRRELLLRGEGLKAFDVRPGGRVVENFRFHASLRYPIGFLPMVIS